MANTDLRIDLAAEFTGRTAFQKAELATQRLERNVKNLGKAFGVTFAAYKITQFGKAAAQAFIQDEKAATLLANTMKNLGLELSAPAIENFVQNLERATGVVDDQLRPAMQTLLQVTGSVTNSQKILAQAIEVSRATGIELTTVAQDLGQAYVGNTKGLRKYSLGLTQAELKAASFADIQERMNKLFGGANEAYLATYAGQMERLGVAAGEAKETIGKGLVQALVTLTASKGVDDLANKMESIAQTTSNIIGSISRFISVTGGILKGETGAQAKARVFPNAPAYKGAIPSIQAAVIEAQQAKAEKAALIRSKALTKEKSKQLTIDKAKVSLAKAQANFDITKIGLEAALKGKISKEEENRLLALRAIENENGELALSYIAKLDYARQQAAQAEEARQKALIESIQARMNVIAGLQDRINAKMAASAAEAQANAIAQIADIQARMATISAATVSVQNKIAGNQVSDIQARMAAIAEAQARVDAKIAGNSTSANNITIKLDGQAFQNAVVDATNNAAQSGAAPWRPNP